MSGGFSEVGAHAGTGNYALQCSTNRTVADAQLSMALESLDTV